MQTAISTDIGARGGAGLDRLGAGRGKVLAQMNLITFRDLVDYPPLVGARMLMAQRRSDLAGIDLKKFLVEEFVARDPLQAAGWPLEALRGIDGARATLLSQIGVNTVADLAALGEEADAAIAAASPDNGFSERPSAPAALIPGIIGSVASSVRYTSFVQDAEVRDFRFEVDKECFFPLPLSGTDAKDPKDRPSLSDVFTDQHCPVIQLGFLCDHRQRWINLGTHLGEVVHSVSLAPGESRNIALVNWRRRQLTSIEQRTTTSEQLIASFVQNRALQEVASAVAQEHQQGKTRTEANTLVTAGSFVAAGAAVGGIGMGIAGAVIGGVIATPESVGTATVVGALAGGAAGAAVGGVAGGAAGGMVFAGAKALGMIEASSDGDRDIASTMQQRIALSTSQNASAVRSVWSTAVVEDVQAESVEASASNITNYNHMHALNIEYYEVLQRYLTQLAIDGVQPLLYLPLTFFDFTDFKFVRDYWDVVRQVVDGDDLRSAGDTYFVDDSFPAAPDLLAPPAVVAAPADVEAMRLNGLVIDVTFRAGDSGLSSAILNQMTAIALELVRGGTSVQAESHSDESDRWTPGVKKLRYHFGGVGEAQRVTAVRLRRDQPFDTDIHLDVRVNGGVLDRESGGRIKDLANSVVTDGATFRKDADRCDLTWMPASDAIDAYATDLAAYNRYLADKQSVEDENARRTAAFVQLQRNIQKLQRLILRRRHFFTRVILNAVEPEEIVQLLEALRLRFGPGPHDVVPLAAIAHTAPLGATSGAFVLRLKPLDDKELERRGLKLSNKAALKRLVNYAQAVLQRFSEAARAKLSVSEQVFLPTGGLFAEAVLGRSNAAEYLDVERYFNWQDAPIPNQAPAVQPPDAGSRYQAPTAQTAAAPSTINLTGPVALPDPTGMQGILAAIQNGNMFRDMSKAAEIAGIVSNLANLSGQMGQAATKLTGDAQQQAMQAATQAGQAAASLAQTMGTQAFQQAGAMGSAMANTMTQQGAMLNQAKKIDAENAAGARGGGTATPGSGAPGTGGPGTSGGTGGPGPSGSPGSGSPGSGGGTGGGTPSPVQIAQDSPGASGSSLTEDVFRRMTGTSLGGGDMQLAAHTPSLPEPPGYDVSPSLWRDLIEYRVPGEVNDVLASRDMRSQTIAAAQGKLINLDAFPILITSMPYGDGDIFTGETLLRHIRLNINEFLSGTLGSFNPYDADVDGPVWNSDNPVKAVLKIDLFGPDNAAVVCTESAPDHWIFNTVETPLLYPGTGTHPVSGQRMFGYVSRDDGSVIVYTRGADRATGMVDATIEDLLYRGGAEFWLAFQQKLVAFVQANGGQAEVYRTFSKRFWWTMVQRQLDQTSWW